MKGKALLAALAGAAAFCAVGVRPGAAATVPLRGAFYYAWYPYNWSQQGIYPYSQYTPSLGFYDSGNSTIISKHVKELLYANVDVGIYSGWGPRVSSDGATVTRFPLYLKASHNTALKWAVYYEEERYRDPTPQEIQSDL